jgi:hypothetical protein
MPTRRDRARPALALIALAALAAFPLAAQETGYYFGAGNIVQLSLKKSARNELGTRIEGYSITLKVSYLFRL